MVVDQIDFAGIAIFDLEDYALVCPHGDCPEAFKGAFERMEAKSRQVHVIRFFGAIKNGEDMFELPRILSGYLAMTGLFKKELQPFALEVSYHK